MNSLISSLSVSLLFTPSGCPGLCTLLWSSSVTLQCMYFKLGDATICLHCSQTWSSSKITSEFGHSVWGYQLWGSMPNLCGGVKDMESICGMEGVAGPKFHDIVKNGLPLNPLLLLCRPLGNDLFEVPHKQPKNSMAPLTMMENDRTRSLQMK